MRYALPLAALATLFSPAAHAEVETITYQIRKDAEPIGTETVRIERTAELTRVEVETHTKARVLFMDFHYDHRRSEEWRGGRLVSMVADTDDDGTRTHAEARMADRIWSVTVNGQPASPLPADSLPLTLWGNALAGHQTLFSIIDAKPYSVRTATVGKETLAVSDRPVEAEHVRIAGDVERDLWYGPDGLLLRATFQRAGFPIEVIRTFR